MATKNIELIEEFIEKNETEYINLEHAIMFADLLNDYMLELDIELNEQEQDIIIKNASLNEVIGILVLNYKKKIKLAENIKFLVSAYGRLNHKSDYYSEYGLNMLLQEIKKIPVLTKEEEKDLFIKIKEGDSEAKKEMIRRNIRLVYSVSIQYEGRNVSQEDLIQEGIFGLYKAIDKFDIEQGNKFSTYAYHWVRQAIGRCINADSRTIRIPPHMYDKMIEIKKKESELYSKLNRRPTYNEIASELNSDVKDVENVMIIFRKNYSLESSLTIEDEDFTLESVTPDNKFRTPEQAVIEDSNKLLLLESLNCLSSRDKKIMLLRYGFIEDKVYTLEEIGDIFGITKEGIRQIEAKSLKKIKQNPIIKNLR